MSDYKLCKQAGLDIQGPGYIDAHQVEALLASAPVVSGQKFECYSLGRSAWLLSEKLEEKDTHTARLLLIEPIHREPEEIRLLREFVEDTKNYSNSVDLELLDQAKEFLKRRDGGK